MKLEVVDYLDLLVEVSKISLASISLDSFLFLVGAVWRGSVHALNYAAWALIIYALILQHKYIHV